MQEPIYLEALDQYPEAKAYVLKSWTRYRKYLAEWKANYAKAKPQDQLQYLKGACERSLMFFIHYVHGPTALRLKLQFTRYKDENGALCDPYIGLHGVQAGLFQYGIDKKKQIAMMLSRDHGKTLIYGCWGVEWIALHPQKIRAPEWSYITASGKLAARKGEYVHKDLEYNPLITALWGSQRKSGHVWNQDRLETAMGFTINFVGAGEQTRGPHPGGATVDDIDDSDTARSETMTANNKEWMWADFYGQMQPDDPLFVPGTNNGRGTMLDEIFFDPETQGPKHNFLCIKIRSCDLEKAAKPADCKITRAIWPAVWNAEKLKGRLLTSGLWAFDREMQNEPHGIDEPIFPADWIRANEIDAAQVPEQKDVDVIYAIDPAWRATELSDYCGWAELWISKRKSDYGTIFMFELDQRRYTADDLANHIVNRHLAQPEVLTFGIESDANQKYIHDYLLQVCMKTGVAPSITQIESEGKDKAARAESVQGLVQSGRVKFIRGKYPVAIDQIVHFAPRQRSGSHDDILDAMVYGLKLSQKWYFPLKREKPVEKPVDFLKDVRQKMNQDKLAAALRGEKGGRMLNPITGESLGRRHG